MLRLLYEYGANFDHQNSDGETILHIVCREGLENFVRFLHQVRANPNLKNKEEETPLHLATTIGNQRIVDLLVDKFKASVHERTKVRPSSCLVVVARKPLVVPSTTAACPRGDHTSASLLLYLTS